MKLKLMITSKNSFLFICLIFLSSCYRSQTFCDLGSLRLVNKYIDQIRLYFIDSNSCNQIRDYKLIIGYNLKEYPESFYLENVSLFVYPDSNGLSRLMWPGFFETKKLNYKSIDAVFIKEGYEKRILTFSNSPGSIVTYIRQKFIVSFKYDAILNNTLKDSIYLHINIKDSPQPDFDIDLSIGQKMVDTSGIFYRLPMYKGSKLEITSRSFSKGVEVRHDKYDYEINNSTDIVL